MWIDFCGGGSVEDAVVTVAGEVTADTISSWLFTLVGDARWRPGMKVVVDYTRALPGDFPGSDVEIVANDIFFDDRWGSALFAVVSDNPATYGMTRMWQEATRSMLLRTEAFRSRDEALAWLASPNDS